MTLQEKYKQLTDAAQAAGVAGLQIGEQDGVLYVDGTAPSGAVKNQLWSIYNSIDPDFRTGDLVMDVVVTTVPGSKARVATQSTNLNIRKGPGTDQPIVGKAAHHETVTVLSKANDQWSLIKTDQGAEGYVYSQYLEVS